MVGDEITLLQSDNNIYWHHEIPDAPMGELTLDKGDATLVDDVTAEGRYKVALQNAHAWTGTMTLRMHEDGVVIDVYTLDDIHAQEDGATEERYAYSLKKIGEVEPNENLDKQQDQGMSSWAVDGVNAAVSNKLVPEFMQSSYTNNITRYEFAQLAIKLVEVKEGKTIADVLLEIEPDGRDLDTILSDNAFVDEAHDINVIAARVLGIVTGVGHNYFNSDASITRQEAAVMLARVASYFNQDISNGIVLFNDNIEIADWAWEAVGYVNASEIMTGVGKDMFSPLGLYTREQAFITFYRLYVQIQ